jgi:RHS repeat-associated protein
VDGDGMGDLLRLELGNHGYKKNLGGTFASPRSLSGAGHIDLESSRLMDVDGDARAELIYIVDDTWRVYRLNGEKWVRISDSPWPGSAGVPLSAPDTVFADLNGDGCTDVIQGAFGAIRVRWGSRTGLSPVVRLPQIAADDATVEPGREDVRFVDVNGDGLADVVYLTDNWAKIWLGHGDGSFAYYNRVAYPWQQVVIPVSDIHLVDLDRDGLQDLIRIGMGTVEWYPGVADGSFSQVGHMVARPAGASVDSVVTIADANGNGSQDIVWSTPGGMWLLDMAGPTTSGMLTSIDNGMGKTTTFQYEGSGVLAIMDENAGKPWTYKLPTSVPVPIFATIDPGAGGPKQVVRYGIADGFWDGEERRFGGFLVGGKTVPAETRDDTLYEETRYYAGLGQDRVLRGKPYLIEQRDGADRVFTRKKIATEARAVAGLPAGPLTRKPATTIEEAYNFENVSTPIETFTTYEYDDQVRLVAEHHAGRLDLTGDEKDISRSYASDEFYGVCDRVYEEIVFAGDGTTLVSRTQTYFTSDGTTVLPLGTIGKGWVAQTQGHVNAVDGRPDITPADIVLAKRRYDAFGNPTYLYESGVERTLGHDSLSLHPTSESVSPSTGKTLTWNMTWDNVLGQPKTVTDPNGVVTAVTYDSLGRQVTAAADGKNPHIIYRYEWTAPKPHTTTYQWDQTLDTAPLVPSGQVPSGMGWRQSVLVANGGGEDLFSATRLTDTRWIVSGWKERDSRGHVVVHGDPFYWDGADVLAAKATEAKPASTTDLYAFRSQALEWDALGRLKKQTLPNLSTKSIAYGAHSQTVTSSDLSPVTSETDGFGRIIHTERTVAGVLEQADATYDAADRLTLISLQGGRDKNGNLLPGKAEHSFTYDTLGRLVRAHDPDIGQRELKYDDRNLLIRHKNGAGNELAFFYDGAGRLTARGPRNDFAQPVLTYTADPRDYRYSYDAGASEAAACQGQGGYTQGRLAAVDEPAGSDGTGGGRVALCYDSLGRQTGLWRRIGGTANGKKAWQWNSLAASGLLLWKQADDGFKLFSDHDRAGRLTTLSDATTGGVKNQPVWSATPDSADAQALDASGRVLTETYGQNVLAQNYQRDALGMPSGIQVDKLGPAPSLLYHVAISARTPYGAPKTVVDAIGGGVDHSAQYAYDGAARLTNAILGSGASTWKFRFEYDGLQNMIGRTQEPPAGRGALPILAGTYHYGEGDSGPRQLTSVVRDCVDVLNTYHYDGAGRMDMDGKKNLVYDGYDQLTSVTDNGAALVSHTYGYDGLRNYTRGAGNSGQYWFASDDTLLPGGTRWHYVSVGDRLVARQKFSHPSGNVAFPPAGARVAWWPDIERKLPQYFVTTTSAGVLLLLGWAAWRRRRPLWQSAPAVACSGLLVLTTPSCGHSSVERRQQGIEDVDARRYFHQGVAAGPTLITDGDGIVMDDRRFEPFGEHIDANMALDPYNSLNKERNAETGWSYHGARWMAPQTARWMVPDPPAKGPDPNFMIEPWGLNPYSYVKQSPTTYWDPDGRCDVSIGGGINCVAPALRADAAVTEAIRISYERGDYVGAAAGVILKLANQVNIAAGMLAQNFVGSGNGTYNAVSGAMEGNYDRMLSGSAEMLSSALQTKMMTPASTAPSTSEVGRQVVTGATGRAANKLKPNTGAEGAHSTFKRGPDGKISNYATYKPNPRNPSGFQETKRVDVTGSPHRNPDGTVVPTPHVKEAGTKGVRPAKPEELP